MVSTVDGAAMPRTVVSMTRSSPHRVRDGGGETARGVVAKSAALLRGFPLSPRSVAERAIERFLARREEQAASDPSWAAIQQRRRRDGSDTLIFRSEDLSWADWESQREIERRITPDPWWLPTARRVANAQPSRRLRRVRHAAQRLRRGWDDTSTYDLAGSLTTRLADQLEHLAESTHGWPDSEEYPTFESWQAELRHQARQLRRWSGTVEQEKALERWHALAIEGEGDPDVTQQAWEELQRIEAADAEAASAAMHWIAANLGKLWD